MRNIPIDKIISSIPGTRGYKSEICRRLHIHVRELNEYIENSTELQDAIADEEQLFIDDAKEALRQRVLDGDIKAIDIALKAKAVSEGYGDKSRLEVTGANGKPLVTLIAPVTTISDPKKWREYLERTEQKRISEKKIKTIDAKVIK